MSDKPAADDMDFAALFEAQQSTLRTRFEIGERLTGRITGMDSQTVFVDLGAKSEGLLDRSEILDAEGRPTVEIGETIEAYCVAVEGGAVRLALRMSGAALDASLREAFEAGAPVEGKVLAERKGGFEVRVGGRSGFCPFSQMDLRGEAAETVIGQTLAFLITEFRDQGRNLVLSRRKLLDRERARQRDQLKETLAVGDILQGKVRKIMPFGVFVDVGGIDGLVPSREVAWGRNIKVEDIVAVGDSVTVTVLDIDWERDRLTLSLRNAAGDPWETADRQFPPGRRCAGVVTRLAPFGAFVELAPGIEGLVHVSKLGGGRRIKHPEEVLAEGDEIEVSIESIDVERRRISLSMEDALGKTGERVEGAAHAAEGMTVRGKVERVVEFGVFIELPDGRTGLLHVSQVDLGGSTNRRRALYDRFKPESQVEVVIREIRGDRISLTLPETLEQEAADREIHDFRDDRAKDFGSLGDVFGNLEL